MFFDEPNSDSIEPNGYGRTHCLLVIAYTHANAPVP